MTFTNHDQDQQPGWAAQWAPKAPTPGPAAEHQPVEDQYTGEDAPTAVDDELYVVADEGSAVRQPTAVPEQFIVRGQQNFAGGGRRALRDVPPPAQHELPDRDELFSDPGQGPKLPPTSGVRKMVFDVTKFNMGRSKADIRRAALVDRMNVSPGKEGYRIAVLQLKGGVGKTTSTASALTALGMNADATRVLGIDANPATGTLKDRLDAPSQWDIRHVLADRNLFTVDPDTGELAAAPTATYPGFTHYTGKSKGNFEVVQGSENIAAAHQLSANEYNALVDVAETMFPIIVTDCGTELHHDVTRAVLARADMVVVVAGTAKGHVEKARQTLNFLHNYPSDDLDENVALTDEFGRDIAQFRHLLSRCIVLINDTGQRGKYKTDTLAQDFAKLLNHYHLKVPEYEREPLTAQVLTLPFDKHLAVDGPIVYDLLGARTKWAILELAAAIGDDFPRAVSRRQRAAAPVGQRR